MSSKSHDAPTHPYHVIEQHSVPIFAEDWGADEELLLLEGAELYGLGSWADIAEHIGGFRTKEEVRDHYIQTYIESSKFPLPERASPHDMELSQRVSREEFQARKKRRIEERKEAAKAAQQQTAAAPKGKPTASVPACHEVQGYMPGRLEFEVEWANDAEDAVQNLQFDPGEGAIGNHGGGGGGGGGGGASYANLRKRPYDQYAGLDAETELKLTVMEIYNARLTGRVERKKVMFEHNLLDYKKNTAAEKRRTREERDIVQRCKPFARMMNHNDYESFCQFLLYELSLRQAVARLHEWRASGLADLRDGEKFETDKAQHILRMQTYPNGGSGGGSGAHHHQQLERLGSAAPSSSPASRLGHHHLNSSNYSSKATPPAETPSAVATLTSSGGPLVPRSNVDSDAEALFGLPTMLAISLTPAQKCATQTLLQPLPGVQPIDFAQSTPPDLHLLQKEEQQLCSITRLQPKPYLLLKKHFLKEATKQGGVLKKKAVKEMSKVKSTLEYRLASFSFASTRCSSVCLADRIEQSLQDTRPLCYLELDPASLNLSC